MFKKILKLFLFFEIITIIFCLHMIPKEIKQPETFYQLESYQYSKYVKGQYGGNCLKYSKKIKEIFPKVKIERIMINYNKEGSLTHYQVILFENDVLIVYTDSNGKGNQIINTFYQLK